MQAQRSALEQHSYDLGCQECGFNEAAGGRRASTAFHFDRFAEGAPHAYPRLMDFALSSRCNLQCVMCHGGLSSSIRGKREGLPPLPSAYDDQFFDELDEFLPHLERAQFKGGEPFLARENRRIWDAMLREGLRPEISVTTNATIFNENVARYVSDLRMHPIISVDGMRPETLEGIRVGVDATTLWTNVDRFQELTEATGVGMTLSFCLMVENWREVLPFLKEADRRGVNPNVVFVNQPHRFDILRRPHQELVEVHRELSALTPSFASEEPGRVWCEILERLRSQIESPVELVVHADQISEEAPVVPFSVELQARLREDLVARHGRAPIVLEAQDATVVDVEEPGWASWLGAGRWVGRPVASLRDAVAADFDILAEEHLAPEVDGVDRWNLHLDGPAGPRTLQVHLFVDERSGDHRVLLVETDGVD